MPEPDPYATRTATAEPGVMAVHFVGKRGALFWLALKTGFWTILTLGFYRFWMKTRLRRWYWSAIRPGGHPMEYVGDPFEKLLGFFIAVVILTFYIGIVNLILMFVSFSVFNSSLIGYAASFAGVIPIWFYARYRARRYVLGRTRWRGVRFGLEPGAWKYAGLALWYWFLTVITVGILWPRMTFLLEKFRTDRTFFGSAKLVQGGRWQMLFPATYPFVISLIASAGLALWLIYLTPLLAESAELSSYGYYYYFTQYIIGERTNGFFEEPWRLWLIPICLTGLLYGAIHYRWASKRIMANHKTAEGVVFASAIKPPRITMIYSLGMTISYVFLVLGVIGVIFVGVLFWGEDILLDDGLGGASNLPQWLEFAVIAVVYLTVFLMWGVLHNAFVTFPLMRHMAVTTTLPTSIGLSDVSQRARDEFAEAEGFAEALDLGAAI